MRPLHASFAALGAAMLALAAPLALAFSSDPFPDVPQASAHYEAIYYLRQKNVLQGYADGTFRPDAPVSRVEAVKILLLGSGKAAEGAQSAFPDVPAGHWGQQYLAKAAQLGYVKGNPDGTFRPDSTVNLAEAMKMVLAFSGIQPPAVAAAPYADVPADAWFAPHFAYAKDKHLLDETAQASPSKALTRAELAELMYRLAYMNEHELPYFAVLGERTESIASVYDGDTMTTAKGEKVRLLGVDTPEKGEPWDIEATALTKNLVLNATVTLRVCQSQPRDAFGRTLAYVITADGASVSEELLKQGLAKRYTKGTCGTDTADAFATLEDAAKAAGLGLWGTATPASSTAGSSGASTGSPSSSSSSGSGASTPKSSEEGNALGRVIYPNGLPQAASGTYSCGTKRYCTHMTSCEEAAFFLNSCGLTGLDADKDGYPCEALCGDVPGR